MIQYIKPVIAETKVIGTVTGKTFVKTVHGSKHFLRQPPAICVDKKAFLSMFREGVEDMLVFDLDTGVNYTVSLQDFWNNKIDINRGHGEQYALPFKFWKKGMVLDDGI